MPSSPEPSAGFLASARAGWKQGWPAGLVLATLVILAHDEEVPLSADPP